VVYETTEPFPGGVRENCSRIWKHIQVVGIGPSERTFGFRSLLCRYRLFFIEPG
jgi:hypothetical protein